MRKLICFILSFALILAGSMCVFADDPEESTSSSGDRLCTPAEEEEARQMLLESAEILYATGSDNLRSTYTIDDIYNFLLSTFSMNSTTTNSTQYEIYLNIYQIHTYIITMSQQMTIITGAIQNIADDFLSNNFGTGLYDIINNYTSDIIDIFGSPISGDTFYSLLATIRTNSNTLASYTTSALNYLNTISSGVSAINTSISSLASNISTIATNTGNTVSSLQSLQNDFNNISWTVENSRFLGIKLEYDDTNYITSGSSYSNQYIFVEYDSSPINYGSVFRFSIPIRSSVSYRKIEISDILVYYVTTNGTYNTYYTKDYYYTYDNPNTLLNIYFSNLDIPRNQKLSLKISFANGDSFTYTNQTPGFAYITNSNLDFYTVSNWIIYMKQINIISKFEDIYASDDIIQAKQNQQNYEDQAIEDFTGSGSAAASTSDLGDLKSVSNTIKQGLASGGSVSNALAPFSTNGGFWGWFSQSNYNDINNLSTNSNTRSGSNAPEVLDFYTNNQLTLQDLLNGN